MAAKNETDYLKKILKIAMNIIKDSERGLILKFENKKWESVYQIGYDAKQVKTILNLLEKGTETQINYQREEKENGIKCLYSPLKFGDKVLGAIIISNTKNTEEPFSVEDRKFTMAFSNLAASFFGVQQHLNTKAKFREAILFSMIKLVELHDHYTKGHSESVSNISVLIAKNMNLSEKQISTIKWAGLVHDIGKILIPKEILNKPVKLSDEEYSIIKKHPEYGAMVLFASKEITEVANIVKYHHESWDGGGYPKGLKETEIPLESRIITVADTFHAMISDRPYRKGLTYETAKNEIINYSGKQFDPQVVKAFLNINFKESDL